MLLQSLLATTLALTSFVAADSNMQRFRRGLPPLPQKHVGMRMKRQAPAPSGSSVPNFRVRGLRVEMPEGSPMAEMQFSAIPSADYYVYELVPLSSQGLPGTFVFTGFYSTTNQMPLYVFKLLNPPNESQPYLVAAYPNSGETVDGQSGAYLGAGQGLPSPYPQTDQYSVSDPTSPYTQAAIFQIDKTNPAKLQLQFVTLDINSEEHMSTRVCLDGDEETIFLPLLFNPCWYTSKNPDVMNNGAVILDLA